jgi:NLR family CARD domain-containing protein 3
MPRRKKKPKHNEANEFAFILDENGQNLRSESVDVEHVTKITKELAINLDESNLNLQRENIGDDGAVELAKALETNRSLTILGLDSNGIGNVGMEALGKALKLNDTLSWLYLNGNDIGARGLRSLADALKSNKTLRHLWLERCSIDDEGASILADGLSCNNKLTSLFLNENRIGDQGARAILDVLNESNTFLFYLELNGNHGISSAIVEALADVVVDNLTGTRGINTKVELDLSQEMYTAEHIPRIAKLLAENTTLKKFKLRVFWNCNVAPLRCALTANQVLTSVGFVGSGIDNFFVSSIASALRDNAVLHSLALVDGWIGRAGVEAVAEMLKINSSLTRLNMSKNEIGDTGAVELANALKTNTTLTSLDLSSNDICDTGAIALFSVLYESNHSLTSLNLERNGCISPVLRKAIQDILLFNYWLKFSQELKERAIPQAVHAVQKSLQPRRADRSETPSYCSAIAAGIIFLLVKATVTKPGLEGPPQQNL